MKSNPALQATLRFNSPAQKCWYAAHLLLAACTSSPVIPIRAAKAAILARAAVVAQTAKPARAATPIVPATANTTGYAFGALYLNSPAYPIGTAIPAISAKPASAAVVAKPAVAAEPAVLAINAPAVAAIKGYEDAVTIAQSSGSSLITVELPYYANVGLVGSDKLVIGEITPSTLQSTAWSDVRSTAPETQLLGGDIATETLEQYFYRNALLCNEHTITDIVRNVNGAMIGCKKVEVTVYHSVEFDIESNSLQFDAVFGSVQNQSPTYTKGQVITAASINPTGIPWFFWEDQASVVAGQNATRLVDTNAYVFPGMIVDSRARIDNINYASDSDWINFVNATPQGSIEREFTLFVQSLPQPVYLTSATFQATLPQPDFSREGKTYLDRVGNGWRYYPA